MTLRRSHAIKGILSALHKRYLPNLSFLVLVTSKWSSLAVDLLNLTAGRLYTTNSLTNCMIGLVENVRYQFILVRCSKSAWGKGLG